MITREADERRRETDAPRRGGSVLPLALLVAAALPPELEADALRLADGSSVEGEIKESATEYEVVTDHGSLWVDKVKVKRRYPPVDAILKGVQETRDRARSLFDQAGQLNDKEQHNSRLREAVKALEEARDTLADAQEVYTAMSSYLRLSQPFKSVIQELRLYRDQFQVGGSAVTRAPAGSAKPAPAAGGVATPASAPSSGGVTPAVPGGTASGPTTAGGSPDGSSGKEGSAPPPVPPAVPDELIVLEAEIRAKAKSGSLDEAYVAYQRYLKEGGESADVRAEVARAFFDRGLKQTPPVLADIRRAFDLDSSTLTYYESFMQASYDMGLDSAKRKQWNDATRDFTQAIRAASELLAKSEKAKYHNVRGMAYHWRGIAEVQKFRGKSGHLQIRSDYRQAKTDYEAVLRLEPSGPYAVEARDNLQNVNNTLKLLR